MNKEITIVLFSIIFMVTTNLRSQELVAFDKNTELKSGIYTTHNEILKNTPRYKNYKLDINDYQFNQEIYNGYGNKTKVLDDILFYVEGKGIWIYFNKEFQSLIIRGTISTYIDEEFHTNLYTNRTTKKDKYRYFDFINGKDNLVKIDKIEEFLIRDKSLFNSYQKLTRRQKKNLLHKYILDFNKRNPIYIHR